MVEKETGVMNNMRQMRRLIPTFLLLIVFIAGYVYASTHDFFRTKQENTEAVPLITMQAQDIDSIMIAGEGSRVSLHKKGEQWEMLEPRPYPLNSYPINDWISIVTKAKADSIVEGEAANLGKYGLDKPTWVFQATGANGIRHNLKIGNETPISGTYYAMVDDNNKVYQVPATEWSGLKRSAYDFVLKEPITFPIERVEQFSWSYAGKTYNLSSNHDSGSVPTNVSEGNSSTGNSDSSKQIEMNWRLQDKSITEDKANVLINQFRDWSTTELPKQKKELLAGLSHEPGWKLELSLRSDAINTSEKKTFEGYMMGEKVWIIPQDGQWAYAVPKEKLDEAIKEWGSVGNGSPTEGK